MFLPFVQKRLSAGRTTDKLTRMQAMAVSQDPGFGGSAIEAPVGGVGARHMQNLLKRFAKDESGATAIEYGLIAALISVVIITVLTTLGTSLESTFQSVADQLDGA
jgi:pilus assembly protein Flp/PilA